MVAFGTRRTQKILSEGNLESATYKKITIWLQYQEI